MILVGIEDCPTCKVAKKFLMDIDYVELKRTKSSEPTPPNIMNIKRALGKLNTSGHFPVLLNDDHTKLIDTDVLLGNLNKQKLQTLLDS